MNAESPVTRRRASRGLHAHSFQLVPAVVGLENIEVPECPLLPVGYELQQTAQYQKRARDERAELKMLDNAVRGKQADVLRKQLMKPPATQTKPVEG